jgi:alpha-glucosidase
MAAERRIPDAHSTPANQGGAVPQSAWWDECIGYEIYLPSFQDSNADGWGDLAGVEQRLSYLEDLGVDLLWITPFYPSPMKDQGYDVSNYLEIDPRYGTFEDFDRLIRSAHSRGMRILADLVVNHTSSQHDWFRRARTSRDNSHRDFYIWRAAAPDGGPPNNWQSHFGGPAWTLDPQTGEHYLHLFTSDQPDLNWQNEAVAREVDAILRFWFERGLDGFRIDTAHYLTKHPDLLDNPPLPDGKVVRIGGVTTDWLRQEHRYDGSQDSAKDIHRRWNRIAQEYDAFLLGEVYVLEPSNLASYVGGDGLHSAFWFGLVESGWQPAAIQEGLAIAAETSTHLAWVQSSHDRSRAVTRYGGGEIGRRRALLVATLTTALPGTPFLYQGEELGLEDELIPSALQRDPLAMSDDPSQGRDRARTPIPWSDVAGEGFTTNATPWLPITTVDRARTALRQRTDPLSPWGATRRLILARRHLPPRDTGPITWRTDSPLIGYQNDRICIVANPSDGPLPLDLDDATWSTVYDTENAQAPTTTPRVLASLQAIVAVRTDERLRVTPGVRSANRPPIGPEISRR